MDERVDEAVGFLKQVGRSLVILYNLIEVVEANAKYQLFQRAKEAVKNKNRCDFLCH